MRFRRHVSSISAAALVFVALFFLPSAASAQTIGVRIGASSDPDQFFFGAHAEWPPIIDRLHFRPNIEVGVGDNVTLAALNFEFAYKFANGRKPWNAYAGGGPALNLYFSDRRDHAEGGFNFLLGLEHRRGLFGEVKVGAIDSPDFKITVGYVLH